jgi:hypothetical protein
MCFGEATRFTCQNLSPDRELKKPDTATLSATPSQNKTATVSPSRRAYGVDFGPFKLKVHVMSKKTEKTAPDADSSAGAAPSASVPAKLTPIGKITTKTCCGALEVGKLPEDGSEVGILKIAGFASGIKSGSTQYGPWHALVGEFAATNMGTGEIFIAKTALIPGAMGEALISSTEEMLAQNADAKLKFSVMVSVKRSPRDPLLKYEFVVRPVLETEFKSAAVALLGLGS